MHVIEPNESKRQQRRFVLYTGTRNGRDLLIAASDTGAREDR